ncbi:MAG: YdcF family protein [Anaerolineaceae bacterium]|nr:YdcF family protein [Anaerolineaceae bacterium]
MFVFLSKFLPQFIYPAGLVCLLLILALIFQRRKKWQNTVIGLALAVLIIAGNRWAAYGLTRSLEWRHLPPAELPQVEAIVVLGGGTEPHQSPRPIVELNSAGDRALYAAYLYQQGHAPHLLLSGGNIDWLYAQESTPAGQMAAVLEMMNVPASAIWLEPESLNTYENAVNCARILADKDIQRIILVTTATHMPRAVALFEHQGIEVIPAPTDFKITEENWQNLFQADLSAQLTHLMPNVSSLNMTTTALKEYLGIFTYKLRGWL